MTRAIWAFVGAACISACSEEVGDGAGGSGPGGGGSASTTTGSGGDGGVDLTDEGTPLSVSVSPDGLVLVDLDEPAVLDETDPGTDGWEIAFRGYDVFTNSGVSGPASGGAFGPFGAPTFLSDAEPDYPFLLEDRTGGAFLRWYAYEGDSHALYSRFHVYGIHDGDAFYKVQILGYYGEIQGAPVSAVYQIRYAPVDTSGVGTVTVIDDLDGTAGGLAGTDDDPSGCLDLGDGTRPLFTVAESLASSTWHLCFRRDAISVNGELGGPRGVGAIDLTRHESPTELPLEEVKAKTPASELAAFEAIDHAALSDPALVYRGDRVVSAFGTAWYEPGAPAAPSDAVWVVQSSDGERAFLLYAEAFEGPGQASPGTVHLRVKPVTR